MSFFFKYLGTKTEGVFVLGRTRPELDSQFHLYTRTGTVLIYFLELEPEVVRKSKEPLNSDLKWVLRR
jgi:hypothetical protein